jgi:alanine-glyoxylate transaminase / serine-glyoxylate transaminase / serine-pyruvate transaminase
MTAMTPERAPINPPDRLLCGPGPSNVEPAVLAAMQKPMLGHLDPDMHEILHEVVHLLRTVYKAPDGLVIPLQATGTSGMETGLACLIEPGDTAIVGVCGFFGRRIVEIARRYGANVVEVEADWGDHVPNAALLDALEQHPDARLIAVVHAETSTGVQHPVKELAEELRGRDTLLFVDCVTSLGGMELDVGGWGIDFAYSCTQKCLAAPPGMSPIAVSERALERIAARKEPVASYSFDLDLLKRYWIDRPVVYHHTAPILHIYALHEALRGVVEEGLEARWARHAEAGAYLQREVISRGFELLAESDRQLPQLTAVRVPVGVDGKAVQDKLLREHDIEVGGGLGPAAPAMWRLGLMGYNATTETADRLLQGFDAVLADEPALASTRA